jgi:hypothetical protein
MRRCPPKSSWRTMGCASRSENRVQPQSAARRLLPGPAAVRYSWGLRVRESVRRAGSPGAAQNENSFFRNLQVL